MQGAPSRVPADHVRDRQRRPLLRHGGRQVWRVAGLREHCPTGWTCGTDNICKGTPPACKL